MSEPKVTHERVIDVRPVPAPQKHPMIFGAFEALQEGESFLLVNDHDPKPLYYQFLAERNGTFSWAYVETGPTTWKVRIGRISPEARAQLPVTRS